MNAVVTALALQLASAAHFVEVDSLLQVDSLTVPHDNSYRRFKARYVPPLKVVDEEILDSAGTRVQLACTNWYGAHMKQYVPNGLSVRSEVEIARKIRRMGFNCVRLTFSTEMFIANPDVRPEYVSKATGNARGPKALDVFDGVVKALTDKGLAVIVNNHIHNAKWCCSGTDGNGIHYNADYSEEQWIKSLVGMVDRYKDNKRVVAFEPLNEPRPDLVNMKVYTWGETDAQSVASQIGITLVDLRNVYQTIGKAINTANPEVLLVLSPNAGANVQCEWMLDKYPLQDLTGVVWGPHDYDFAVTDSLVKMCDSNGGNSSLDILQAWLGLQQDPPQPTDYSKMTYDEFASVRDHAYGHLAGKAPVILGEFGIGNPESTDSKRAWWEYVRRYIQDEDFSFAYWSVDGEKWPSAALALKENGTELQEETYGLLMPDYKTIRHKSKRRQLKRLHGGVVLFGES